MRQVTLPPEPPDLAHPNLAHPELAHPDPAHSDPAHSDPALSAPAQPPLPERDQVRPGVAGYAAARRIMIESQLRPNGVNDRAVLERMAAVPREDCVPAAARGNAYMDRAVPLGPGPDGAPRFLAAPEFHGLMLQEAAPRAGDTVLLVDGGSGYLAELLRPMVASLVAIAPAQALRGEGARGACSLLLIDGAVEQVPAALAALLQPDGRAVTGLVEDGVTRLAVGRRTGEGAASSLALLPLAELGIPVLPQFARPRAWTF